MIIEKMETKVCKKCNIKKLLCEFGIFNRNKDGLNTLCKVCYRKKQQKWRKDNIDEVIKKRKKLYYDNQDKSKEYSKQYYNENKIHYNKRSLKWNKQNVKKRREILKKYSQKPEVKLRCNLGHRIYMFLTSKSQTKNKKTEEMIGCDFIFIKNYLALKFTEGMSWENYGKWHIDHIIPLSSATTEEELYKLCHYTNLQPLWAEDNMKKGNKFW
jgi:hypothetical protein